MDNEAAISELFTEINKAEPVKDVDLPGASTDKERVSAVGMWLLRCARYVRG